MAIQARAVPRRAAPGDVEKAPLVDTPDNLEVEGDDDNKHARRRTTHFYVHPILTFLAVSGLCLYNFGFPFPSPAPEPLPPFVEDGMKQCAIIARPPPTPKDFTAARKRSDRFAEGTGAVWLKNATLWTGENDGEEVLYGADVWLDGGVIRRIGKADDMVDLLAASKDYEEVELNGAWVTPGIVDVHSHLAVDASPELKGNSDTNSWKASIQPWLRSLDGFNTHDQAFNLSISGGITTMLVLPGSAGNIGGQAFTFKPRWTKENSPQSMQVEPPFVIEESDSGENQWTRTGAWRHIKVSLAGLRSKLTKQHACGENPLRGECRCSSLLH